MRSLACLASLLAVLCGCYSFESQNGMFSCLGDGRPNDCPDRQICAPDPRDGIKKCFYYDTDLAGLTATDGGMSLAPGCVNQGFRLSDKAWACPGPFKKGDAPKLCAPGYWLCPKLDPQELAACKTTTGFFISQNWLWSRMFDRCNGVLPMYVNCAKLDATYQYRNRMGCGANEKGFAQACDHSCQDFSQGLSCERFKPAAYTCGQNQSGTEDESTSPEIGVLCCVGP